MLTICWSGQIGQPGAINNQASCDVTLSHFLDRSSYAVRQDFVAQNPRRQAF